MPRKKKLVILAIVILFLVALVIGGVVFWLLNRQKAEGEGNEESQEEETPEYRDPDLPSGFLYVDSDPDEALVYVNNVHIGGSEEKLNINVGTYDVEVRKEDYEVWEKEGIKIEENKTTKLEAKLDPLEVSESEEVLGISEEGGVVAGEDVSNLPTLASSPLSDDIIDSIIDSEDSGDNGEDKDNKDKGIEDVNSPSELVDLLSSNILPSPDGSKLLILLPSGNNEYKVYVYDKNNKEAKLLLDTTPIYKISWSSDGKSVSYFSQSSGGNGGGWYVYSLDEGKGNPLISSSNPQTSWRASVSPTDGSVFFTKVNGDVGVTKNGNDTVLGNYMLDDNKTPMYSNPVYSPDGKYVALLKAGIKDDEYKVGAAEVVVCEVGKDFSSAKTLGKTHIIPQTGNLNDVVIYWTPDSSKIIVGDSGNIFDVRQGKEIFHKGSGEFGRYEWSLDGSMLLVWQMDGLYKQNANGKGKVKLSSNARDAVWVRGNRIVLAEGNDLHLMESDGGNKKKLVDQSGVFNNLSWDKANGYLYYSVKNKVYRVKIG